MTGSSAAANEHGGDVWSESRIGLGCREGEGARAADRLLEAGTHDAAQQVAAKLGRR